MASRLISSASHLSPETLAAYCCAELSRLASWRVRRHLAACDACRERKQALEGPQADAMLAAWREATSIAPEALPEAPREAFALWLQAQPLSRGPEPAPRLHPAQPSRLASLGSLRPGSLSLLTAAAVVAMVVLLVGAASLPWWPSPSAPAPRPDALLERAAKLDAPQPAAGAVRQTILIKAGPRSLKRSLYWDPAGRRRAKRVVWTRDDDPLGAVSVVAGLDWDRPLSASAYATWRSHQRVRADSVTRSADLLTLATTVPGGAVAGESLTLRESDLHAVARTVDLRGRGTVEIAELDYAILPWTAVPPAAFEPPEPLDRPLSPSRPALLLPVTPASDQLDSAELAARLILNQLHADVGEQIEIRRTPRWVEVSGLVEAAERKRQLHAALSQVPRLRVSIVTADEARSAPSAEAATVAEASAALPDHPSALETWLAARGLDVPARNALARQLFAGTLTISQECKALAELDGRFPRSGQLPLVAAATLATLRYSHQERLVAALRQQRLVIAQLRDWAPGIASAPGSVSGSPAPASPGARTLTRLAEDNLALTRELTQTSAPASRSAERVLEEMAARLDALAAASRWQPTQGSENTAQQDRGTESLQNPLRSVERPNTVSPR